MIGEVNEAADLFEVQRERVLAVFEKWRASLGLKWWSIDLSWEYDRSLFKHDDDGFECIAYVDGHWPYRTATIHINMHLLHERSDDELERDILHEMVHIPLFEMQPDQADFVEHRERVVCTLAQAFGWVWEAGAEEAEQKKEQSEPRSTEFSELPTGACNGCPFNALRGCTVPGGACLKRKVGGLDYLVGDVLVEVGAIDHDQYDEALGRDFEEGHKAGLKEARRKK